MSAFAQSAGVLGPIQGLWAFLLEAVGLGVEEAADDEPRLSPEVLASSRRIYDLTRPAWEALNLQSLKQSLGDIALSQDAAAFLIETASRTSVGREAVRAASAPGAFRAPPYVVARLGKPAADILTEALEIGMGTAVAAGAVAASELASKELNQRINPLDLAKLRHRLILGDVVPAYLAQTMLSAMRGEMALLMLLVAAIGTSKLREWMGVPLGEIGVQGMRDLVQLSSVDFAQEVEKYAAFKNEVFERLGASNDGSAPDGT